MTKPRKLMDPSVFALAMQRISPGGAKQYEAARMVLVDGRKMSQVSRIVKSTAAKNNFSRTGIYRAIAKIEGAIEDLGICPHCGQKMPDI